MSSQMQLSRPEAQARRGWIRLAIAILIPWSIAWATYGGMALREDFQLKTAIANLAATNRELEGIIASHPGENIYAIKTQTDNTTEEMRLQVIQWQDQAIWKFALEMLAAGPITVAFLGLLGRWVWRGFRPKAAITE